MTLRIRPETSDLRFRASRRPQSRRSLLAAATSAAVLTGSLAAPGLGPNAVANLFERTSPSVVQIEAIVSQPVQTPFGGEPHAIPGRIEAEAFDEGWPEQGAVA